ncbi:MAG: protoheme IX farnesyltransferase [Deltaproteobacteria bacterium]|nr:protoheme IX farnesyltransferase [Deltaproteobacteria bacterium]
MPTTSAQFPLVSATATRLLPMLRELWLLSKPGIVAMCLITTAGGMALAPGSLALWQAALVLIGTAGAVAAASSLNMYLERDVDAKMARTANRPLPQGRVNPLVALAYGLVLAAVSLLALWVVSPLAAVITGLALDGYVLVYTPLKRKSVMSVFVGLFPGAAPPLIGWVAVSGSIDLSAILLFSVLAFWQIPHFLAIELVYRRDYQAGGLVIVPSVFGDRATTHLIALSSLLLVVVSLLIVPMGLASWIYLAAALLAGGLLVRLALRLSRASGDALQAAARRFFFGTLLYLPVLLAGLVIDVVVL